MPLRIGGLERMRLSKRDGRVPLLRAEGEGLAEAVAKPIMGMEAAFREAVGIILRDSGDRLRGA